MNSASVSLLLQTLRLRDESNTQHTGVEWNSADWHGLLPLLAFEGAELWLYRRVQQRRISIPDALKSELRTAVHAKSVINMRIDAQTIAVTSLLARHDIAWVLLKGQARRAAATLYPFADARAVSDVDLLLPPADASRAWELLRANGFRRVVEEPVDWKADHHRPTLIDASNVSVELHTTTSMSVAPDEAWRRATAHNDHVEWSGISVGVPNATELVWQALSHSVADGAAGYTLKSFLSVASVLAAQPTIHWAAIDERIKQHEVLNNETEQPVPEERVRRFLGVAAELSGTVVPAVLKPSHAADIAPLLLWRAQTLASSRGRAVKERLLEEAARVETLLPLTPLIASIGVLRNARRRSASVAARLAYQSWHVGNGGLE